MTQTGHTSRYDELVALFADDPSEALYRAEEELAHAEFMDFVQFASGDVE